MKKEFSEMMIDKIKNCLPKGSKLVAFDWDEERMQCATNTLQRVVVVYEFGSKLYRTKFAGHPGTRRPR